MLTNKVIGIVLLAIPALSFAFTPMHSCMTLQNHPKNKAEISIFNKSINDYILYSNGSKNINIYFNKKISESIDDPANGQIETTYLWLEGAKTKNKATGEYVISIQGASINSIVYRNFKSNKKYTYEESTPAASTSSAHYCW